MKMLTTFLQMLVWLCVCHLTQEHKTLSQVDSGGGNTWPKVAALPVTRLCQTFPVPVEITKASSDMQNPYVSPKLCILWHFYEMVVSLALLSLCIM